MNNVKAVLIICGTVIVALILAAYFFLLETGHQTDQFTAFLTITVPLMVGSGVTLYSTFKNGQKIREIAAKTDVVVEQTNGPMSKQTALITDLHNAIVPDSEVKNG